MDEIKVALFGVGGYAANYLYAVAHPQREGVRLVAAVDPFNKDCDLCPVYDTAEEMYANHQPDLVVVATPLHFHVEQAVEAFAHGCHVALEKPIAPDMDGVRRILEARDKAGKMLCVGFNLCADTIMQQFKADAEAGLFGKPMHFKAIVLWPRNHAYYTRGGGWAGKKYAGNGSPLFDSVLSNATAHYLMNMLFLLGEPLTTIECQTYRANPIETYDTAIVKGQTASGAGLFIAVSHAGHPEKKQNPTFCYEFENATVTFDRTHEDSPDIVATFKDGTQKIYPGPLDAAHLAPFWNMIDALRGLAPIACPGETAALHVDTIEKMRTLQPESTPFPEKWIRELDEYNYIPGLAEALHHCYDVCELPAWNLQADQLGGE